MDRGKKKKPTRDESMFVFKMTEKGPPLVRRCFEDRGWKPHNDESLPSGTDWNLWWKSSRFKPSESQKAGIHQRINHFPKTQGITKKDSLLRNLRKMKVIHGSIYNFFPQTFVLPHEYTKFVGAYSEQETKEIWICKPVDSSRGRKIFLIRDLGDLHYDQQYVVQKYIPNPMLIAEHKFDLRIYALVTSYHPLKIYVYKDGLARFGTAKYDTSSLNNLYSHLTNASINKNSVTFDHDKDTIGTGCKWTLDQLRSYFQQKNIDDSKLWPRITNIVILTLIMIAENVPKTTSCFELFGIDILLDTSLKPWLLEVNCSPALGSDCEADENVKVPLIHDMLEVLNFHSILKDVEAAEKKRKMKLAETRFVGKVQPRQAEPESAEEDVASNHGQFELVFPFNKRTDDAARYIAGEKAGRNAPKNIKSVQDALKLIVSEIKENEREVLKREQSIGPISSEEKLAEISGAPGCVSPSIDALLMDPPLTPRTARLHGPL